MLVAAMQGINQRGGLGRCSFQRGLLAAEGPEGDRRADRSRGEWWLIPGGSHSKCKGLEAALVLAPGSPGGSEGRQAGVAAPALEQGPFSQKGLCLDSGSAVAVWKFPIIFEQEVSKFRFALGPANSVAGDVQTVQGLAGCRKD